MAYQSEAALEKSLIEHLQTLGYELASIHQENDVLSNLKVQLERFNECSLTEKEFNQVLNHLSKGSVFDKAKTLRDRFAITRESGEVIYLQFFDTQNVNRNHWQVTHQVTQEGIYKNRYDVTLLVNGLPLVQIELKRRGLELKEAFNQINRYQRHSFWTNHGLFQFVQVFVISNGVNTKYYANNRGQSFKQTFFWADEQNRNITELAAFTDSFLNTSHLGEMIGHYIVLNETFKVPMILRPYQYYAVKNLIHAVRTSCDNGYIWHTTGSGKTLTSFKASQLLMNETEVDKVVFVVDRKDLDYQTEKEFNAFKKGSVDATDSTHSLVKQFNDGTKLILTTIQKLNNAITQPKYQYQMSTWRDKRLIFIFDECHRSQFGETHGKITEFFSQSQLFGFTGTPIFADNAARNAKGKRTTKDLFGECLHKYVITDAIRDENVLRFNVEYVGRYKQNVKAFVDIEVEDIDTKEVLESPERASKIVDYMIRAHAAKTYNSTYSALFATSSIDMAIRYYELFKAYKAQGKHDLRVATVFTFQANEDDPDAQDMFMEESTEMTNAAEPMTLAQRHSRDRLAEFIEDYNQQFGTKFSAKDGQALNDYFKDVSKRLKEREKVSFDDEANRLDLVIVVNMMLTGFDAKKVNTLYVDKNLRYHGLIQAFSRTNRIMGEQKSQGNIVCFRNLKKATDEAITLFSNKEAIEEIILPPIEDIIKLFKKAFYKLLSIVPDVHDVANLASEEEQAAFVQTFRQLMRLKNVLVTMAEFDWEQMPCTEQEFEDYKSAYLDIYERVKGDHEKEKVSILEDIDFELELLHRDEINVAYILKLLAKLKNKTERRAYSEQRKQIIDLLGGDIQLRSKRELIEKFIDEQLPHIEDSDQIEDEFERFWQEEKVVALGKLCEEEHLDAKQFSSLIDTYVYSGKEPIREDVLKCLDNRPSILKAREIGERILTKMRVFVETFVQGMAG
ncbi:type I restriction endonuclease subunit R [bacterium]|nr:MAG: type I restriction endonuclease subunit R [bacterium]